MLKFLVLGLLVALLHVNTGYCQNYKGGVQQNTIRIKLKPSLGKAVNISKDGKSGTIQTGITALDNMNTQYSVTNMKRVFPYSPKFEEKHQKHGLHLWYEVTVSSKAAILDVKTAYAGLHEVEISESIFETKLIQPGTPVKADLPSVKTTGKSEPFNDPYLPAQWHYNNTGQTGGTPGEDIRLYNAWSITTGSSDVIVSIHDQGVDVDHDDLVDAMWVNEAELNGEPNVDDDGNGYKDDINGFNFSDNMGDIPGEYHGTHVAGTIGAVNNNGIGVAGVAGGSGNANGTKMISCRILGGASTGNTPDSYVYAADMGAVISQNSWGYTQAGAYEQVVLDAIDYFIAEAGDYDGSPMKGGVVIFAAGNDNTNGLHYPGAYESCICVSSLSAFGVKASYSNYGYWVDIAAPGGESSDDHNIGGDDNFSNGILSTLVGNAYGYLDGTSMACPHVSGIAALVTSKHGSVDFTANDLKRHLLTGVRESLYEIEGNQYYIDSLGLGYSDALLSLATDNGIAPEAIADLSIASMAQDFANLQWTVHADEDDYIPYEFELIYSTEAINQANMEFAKTIRFRNLNALGETVNYEIQGLAALTNYNFAVRSIDRWGNISDFSNIQNATTNAGPDAEIDSTDVSVDITIDVTVNTAGTDKFKLYNYGSGLLRWDALSRHITSEPLSTKPVLDYPLANLSSVSSPKGFRCLTYDNVANPTPFNVEDENNEELHYCRDWYNVWVIGETDTSYTNSAATRFVVENEAGFNLTQVDAIINHNEATGPIILEVYEGENISNAKLLLAQEVSESASLETGINWTYIELTEQIYFEQGTTFWVVYHVPSGNEFPMGASLEREKSASENCYMSLNMGKTWTLFEDAYYDNQIVWSVVAMSQYLNLDEYIVLNPDNGDVISKDSTEILASVDATNMINGLYQGNIVINTNETGEPMLRIPVNVTVLGHLPKITSVKRVDFGSILYGNEKTLEVSIKNEGLGKFYGPEITTVSDDQFEYLGGLKTLNSGDEISLAFKYKPNASGTAFANVLITDTAGVEFTLEIVGSAVEPPIARLNLEEDTFTNLAIGDTVNGSFYLVNDGPYPLDYYLPTFADGSNITEISENVHKFGYRASSDISGINPAYEWNDISATGVNVTENINGTGSYKLYHQVDLGFEFSFFGENEDSVYISRYGLLSFDKDPLLALRIPMKYKNYYCPDRYISAHGLQMNFAEAKSGDVYFQRFPDKFVVQYENVPYENGYIGSLTFQIVLHDNGNINIYYKEVDFQEGIWGIPDWTAFYYTFVAIEDQTQDDGVLIHQQDYDNFRYQNGSSVEFINPGNGLYFEANNTYGTLEQSDSILIEYQLETNELNVDDYTESLVVITNDPFNNPAIYSANLDIATGGVPEIHATDSVLDFFSVFQNDVEEINLNFVNTGKASDSLLTASFDNDYFYIQGNNIPEIIKPGRTLYYTIGIKTATIGVYTDTLRITTKAGNIFKVALKGEIVSGPEISLNIPAINTFMNAGTTKSFTLTVSNPGDHELDMAFEGNDWITFKEKTTKSTQVPDFSYNWKRSDEEGGPVYEWEEIAEGDGIKLEGLDPYYEPHWSEGIKLPFTFNYYGVDYDTLYIGYSGLVSFTGGQEAEFFYAFGGYLIPSPSMPDNYIAPLWLGGGADWAEIYPHTGQYYKIEEDRIIVEYRDYINGFSMGYPISYQVILYSNGNIKFQYKMPEFGHQETTNLGCIGIENQDGTDGVQLSYNQKFINSDVAVSLYPSEKYVIPAGGSKEFDVTLDSKTLIGGKYTYDVNVINNAPSGLDLQVPVTLTVIGTPEVEVPDSVYFGDIMIEGNPYVQEFQITNPGTEKFYINDIAQNLAENVLIEYNDYDKWYQVSSMPVPYRVEAQTSLDMRITLDPLVASDLNDTLVISSSDVGLNKIPIIAEAFMPPVVNTDTDLIEVYASVSDYTEIKDLVIDNSEGGYDLNYSVTIDYDRSEETSIQDGEELTFTSIGDTPELLENKISTISDRKEDANSKEYNRILSHDDATEAESALGYGGAAPFHAATGFVAPENGFNLTHVQTWFAAGDWLNGDITVNIFSGSVNINNCDLLFTQEYEYSVPEQDMVGELITIELSESIIFYPNEVFFVEFVYDAGSSHPQGVVSGLEPIENRFYFGQGNGWTDIVGSGFDTYGWMTRAVEETYESSAWVVLESDNSGAINAGANTNLSLNFKAMYANPGDNYADLHIYSNDLNTPDKIVKLLLKRNQGPVFDVENAAFTVIENTTLDFQVIANDLEGDNFTFEVDDSYDFISSIITNNTVDISCTPGFDNQGIYSLNITATDEYGNSNINVVTIDVVNVNRKPVALTVDTLHLAPQGDYYYLEAEEIFTDEDNEDLQLEVAAQDPSVVEVFTSESNIIIKPLEAGETIINIIATDPHGETASNILYVVVSDQTTGIEDVENSDIRIFPNPTQGKVYVNIPESSEEATISIINPIGVILNEIVTDDANSLEVDLNNYPDGFYFIKIKSGEIEKTFRIIKE